MRLTKEAKENAHPQTKVYKGLQIDAVHRLKVSDTLPVMPCSVAKQGGHSLCCDGLRKSHRLYSVDERETIQGKDCLPSKGTSVMVM
jgi:hypothetical protein